MNKYVVTNANADIFEVTAEGFIIDPKDKHHITFVNSSNTTDDNGNQQLTIVGIIPKFYSLMVNPKTE